MDQGLTNYLTNTLSFSPALLRALSLQGVTSFQIVVDLEEEEVKQVCRVIRRPGGTIANPVAAQAGAAQGNVQATIPDPGTAFPLVMEKRLKMLWYYKRHLQNVSRTFSPGQATLARLLQAWRLKERHDSELLDDVPLPPKLTDTIRIREAIENVTFYLQTKRGVRGHPLAYVTREAATVPPVADDPGYGIPDSDSELIRRGDHSGPNFTEDNQTVWAAIRHVTHDGPAWSWVMSFARTRDGRGAFLALKAHYLGDATQGRLRAHADAVLSKTFYDGKSRNFSFEKYCETLNKAIQDLEDTGESVPMDRQVRILLNGIKDPRLASAVNTVLSTPSLRADFDLTINHLAQVLDLQAPHRGIHPAQSRTISGIKTGGRGRGGRGRGRGGRGRGRGQGNIEITDRYYTSEEWAALTSDQREQVCSKRSDRDRRRNVAAIQQTPTNDRNTRQRSNPSTPTSNPGNNSGSNSNSPATNNLGDQAIQRRS